jgi:hypothetical protein
MYSLTISLIPCAHSSRCKHVKQTVEGHTEENENGEFSSEEDVKASQSGKNSQCEKEIEINRLRQTVIITIIFINIY